MAYYLCKLPSFNQGTGSNKSYSVSVFDYTLSNFDDVSYANTVYWEIENGAVTVHSANVTISGNSVSVSGTYSVNGGAPTLTPYVKIFYTSVNCSANEKFYTSGNQSFLSAYPLSYTSPIKSFQHYPQLVLPVKSGLDNDSWLETTTISNYYESGDSAISVLKLESAPMFSHLLTTISTVGTTEIIRESSQLKIGSKTFTSSDFACGNLPTRLLIVMQSAGGNGGRGASDLGGGGGGSGACVTFILKLSMFNSVFLYNGSATADSKVYIGDTSPSSVKMTIESGHSGHDGGSGGTGATFSASSVTDSNIIILDSVNGVSGGTSDYGSGQGSSTSTHYSYCTKSSSSYGQAFTNKYRHTIGSCSGGTSQYGSYFGGGGGASYYADGGNGSNSKTTGFSGSEGSGGGGGYLGYSGGSGGTGYIAIYACE